MTEKAPSTALLRDTLVEEADDWLDQPEGDFPLWLWWPIGDADVSVMDVACYASGRDEECPEDAQEPGVVREAILEQLRNASPAQIENYHEAREAWLNQP